MILNNKKPIYGVVDSVEEDVRYTGEKTTTASVTVNNVDRTIKVDVNTTALLGETAASAYPGNKGANLAKEVSKFTNSIKELKDQIQETDLALRQSIAEVISDSTESDEALRAQIIAEEQRALAAEVAIRDIAQTASDKVDYITNNAVDDIAKLREEITLIEKQVYNEVDVLEDHMIEGFASLQGEIDTIVTDKIESVIDQVHKDVADQTEVLKSDVEKLQTADSQLKQDIKNLSKDIARVESGAISAIQTAVAQVDTKLAQTVATVTDYVNTSVEELHESIDSLDTSVDGRIQLAVKELDSKLDVETKRATSKV